MKTPKEKAKELVKEFWMKNKTGQDSYGIAINNAKIAVDEIMDDVIHLQDENQGVYGTNNLFDRHIYWQEVKAELNKV